MMLHPPPVDQVEAVFVALFLASIGIILSPAFLFQHALFLGMTFVVCIAFKVLIFLAVVKAFRYPTMVSVAVAFSLAPISEFAFVILSSCYKAGGESRTPTRTRATPRGISTHDPLDPSPSNVFLLHPFFPQGTH